MSDILIPQLSESTTSGTVVNIRVKVGDNVLKGATLLELETEKAVLEVPSSETGTIQEVLLKVGDVVKVGQKAFSISTSGVTPTPDKSQQAQAPAKTTGAAAPQGPLPETAPPRPAATHLASPVSPEPTANYPTTDVAAAPSVRLLAREIGVDIQKVNASGPNGRITIDDVKAHAKKLLTTSPAPGGGEGRAVPPSPGAGEVVLPDFSKWGEVTREPMSGIRKKTAQHLAQAWASIPHVTQFTEANITELEVLRKEYSTDKLKLSVLPFVIKVVAAALRNFPKFNASIDVASSEVIYKKYCHIGVAVDTEHGLLVPIIRNADKRSILEIAEELVTLSEKARNRKLTLEEMQGGSFTITNLGALTTGHFTPIINAPEVGILGISRAQLKPSYEDGKVCAPRLMLPLSLSYDHRLIDGADGARFIRWVTEAIRQPFLLELK